MVSSSFHLKLFIGSSFSTFKVSPLKCILGSGESTLFLRISFTASSELKKLFRFLQVELFRFGILIVAVNWAFIEVKFINVCLSIFAIFLKIDFFGALCRKKLNLLLFLLHWIHLLAVLDLNY